MKLNKKFSFICALLSLPFIGAAIYISITKVRYTSTSTITDILVPLHWHRIASSLYIVALIILLIGYTVYLFSNKKK